MTTTQILIQIVQDGVPKFIPLGDLISAEYILNTSKALRAGSTKNGGHTLTLPDGTSIDTSLYTKDGTIYNNRDEAIVFKDPNAVNWDGLNFRDSNGNIIYLSGTEPNHSNEGHYIGEGTSDTDEVFSEIMQRIKADTTGNFKGVCVRYTWGDLESEQGVYPGIDKIEERLKVLAATGNRKLILFLQLKTFHTKNSAGTLLSINPAVPKYMRESALYADPDGYTTSTGGHGAYSYASNIGGPGGEVPNMHVDAVRDRYITLVQMLGYRLSKYQNLEAIVFNEASINQPVQCLDSWDRYFTSTASSLPKPSNGWFDNMTLILKAVRTSLPKVGLCQWINGPRSAMQVWLPQQVFAIDNVGVGMPDLCRDDKAFNYDPIKTPNAPPGSIHWCKTRAGNGMIITHASKPAQDGTVVVTSQTLANSFPGQYSYPGLPQTTQDIADFAYEVGSTHVIWRHYNSTHNINTTYLGRNYNEVVDEWISNPSSNLKVNSLNWK